MCGIPVSPDVARGIDFFRKAENEGLYLSEKEKRNVLWIIRSFNGIWLSANLTSLAFFLVLSAVYLVPTIYFIRVTLHWPFFIGGGICIEPWSIVLLILFFSALITWAIHWGSIVKAAQIRIGILAEEISGDPEKIKALSLLRQVLGDGDVLVGQLSGHMRE